MFVRVSLIIYRSHHATSCVERYFNSYSELDGVHLMSKTAKFIHQSDEVLDKIFSPHPFGSSLHAT